MWKQKLEAVKFLWKQKHFEKRNWKQKQTPKVTNFIQSWKQKQKNPKSKRAEETQKYDTWRGAEAKNILLLPHPCYIAGFSMTFGFLFEEKNMKLTKLAI